MRTVKFPSVVATSPCVAMPMTAHVSIRIAEELTLNTSAMRGTFSGEGRP